MRRMLINARDRDLVRVAICAEDGTLEEIDIEYADQTAYKGNIYKAQVVRVEPSLGAAFVDFGGLRNGFLPLHEVSGKVLKEAAPPQRRRGKEFQDGELERGQEVIVQATREPKGSKGAAMTTYVALPGRYLVYLPDGETSGISRKIASRDERQKLSDTVKQIRGKRDVGLIVRTAGIERKKTDLQKDFRYLDRLWKEIVKDYRTQKGPGIIWREQNAVIRAVRDYYTEDIEEIWIDHPDTHEELSRFFELTMPEKLQGRVRLYEGAMPLFAKYKVEEQLQIARQREVSLPSGGSIVIDPTEALVSIDVNSGKQMGEKNIEETAFKTNCEAANELARQLRLRNLGGIVVIDFIDMRDRRKRTQVEKILKDAFKTDKAATSFGRISRFGTLEMLRQRLRTSGTAAGYVACDSCRGTGRVKSTQLAALDYLRDIRAAAATSPSGTQLRVRLPEECALFLLNERRRDLLNLEQNSQVRVVLEPVHEVMHYDAPPPIERESYEEEEKPAGAIQARAGAVPIAGEERAFEEKQRILQERAAKAAREAAERERARQKDAEREGAATRPQEERHAEEEGDEQPRKKRRRGTRGGRRRRRGKGGQATAQNGQGDVEGSNGEQPKASGASERREQPERGSVPDSGKELAELRASSGSGDTGGVKSEGEAKPKRRTRRGSRGGRRRRSGSNATGDSAEGSAESSPAGES